MRKLLFIGTCLVFLTACKRGQPEQEKKADTPAITHAKGFHIEKGDGYTILEVSRPWPGATEKFTYLLLEKGRPLPANATFDAVVRTPVEKIVVTSTTHIPALEALGVEEKLVGFPGTNYISSEKTRKNVDSGKVAELGKNESINTEMLIALQPDVLVGFAINNQNKVYKTLQNSGVPVVYNGDWAEETPLGKAEWIKFFAPFFNAQHKADSVFNAIETEYRKAKEIAGSATETPSVLSGAMYKDVWYLPAGESWAARFLQDANADYLWKDSEGTGSLSLSFENVLETAQEAEVWIAPGQFSSYEALENASPHYTQFKAFKNRRIYTFSLTKGVTGGVLYYELAPNRPDLILKDMIRILHPELLPGYEPFFFKPLQ